MPHVDGRVPESHGHHSSLEPGEAFSTRLEIEVDVVGNAAANPNRLERRAADAPVSGAARSAGPTSVAGSAGATDGTSPEPEVPPLPVASPPPPVPDRPSFEAPRGAVQLDPSRTRIRAEVATRRRVTNQAKAGSGPDTQNRLGDRWTKAASAYWTVVGERYPRA